MRDKEGSTTITYRFKLHYKNLEWLDKTKELYNQLVLFYYDLLLVHTSLLDMGNQKVLRELECMTITARDKTKPDIPLPYEKVPVYFRRAAINAAIGLVRTYHSKWVAWCEDSSLENPVKAKEFHAQPLFYKGMYKEFEKDCILLKLWTGTAWVWVKHGIKGRRLPEDCEVLSPTIAIDKKKVMLHVPVKCPVSDIRTVKERVEDKERICSVVLSSSDTLAVCTVMEDDGRILDSCFIRGGNELKHRRKCLSGKIARNIRLSGGMAKGIKSNVKLYEKRRNITEYYSHMVSSRIVSFCREHGAKLIIFQKIERIVPLKDKKYMDVIENDFIIRRVIRYVEYKAFLNGIVTTTVRPNYTSCKCHKCRTYVKRYGKKEKESTYGKYYICENGHQGNSYLNTSRNIGLMFVRKARVISPEVIKAG